MLVTLLWIYLLYGNSLEAKTLQCKSDCHKREKVTLNDGRKVTCTIKNTSVPPSGDRSIIAPAPQLIDSKMWYVHLNKTIALNITWKQKESHISNHEVQGYYLVVDNSGALSKYNVQIRIKGKKMSENLVQQSDYISFQFLCHGLKRNYFGDLLRQGDTRRVTIRSTPLADLTHQDGVVYRIVKIPRSEERSSFHTTASSIETTIMTEKEKLEQFPIFIPLLAVIITVGITVVVAIVILKRSRSHHVTGGCSNILAIADMENTEDTSYHGMTEKLSQHFRFTIQSNWASRETISKKTAVGWFAEQLKIAEIIIFIDPPVDQTIGDNTEFQQYWNHFINSKKSSKKKVIILQSSGQERAKISNQLKKFNVFPLVTQNMEDSLFFKHMKCLSKPNREPINAVEEKASASRDYAREGARPKQTRISK